MAFTAFDENHGFHDFCDYLLSLEMHIQSYFQAFHTVLHVTVTQLVNPSIHQPNSYFMHHGPEAKKGKGQYSSSWEPHLKATRRHFPYGFTQCYLPPDTSECVLPNPSHAGWYSIYLPRDGRLS